MSAWRRPARGSLALVGAVIAVLLVARTHAIAADDASGAPVMPERPPAALTVGSPASAHRLVIWSDYECAACALLERASGAALRDLTARGTLRVEIRHFPLTGHRRAPRAAAAAICAARHAQGWEMHEALMRSAPIWSGGSPSAPWFAHLADSLGIDGAALLACADDPETAGLLAGDVALGRTLGLTAVPAVFLDGRLLRYRTPAALVRRLRGVVEARAAPR
jgi:protein-disulfide isomerase